MKIHPRHWTIFGNRRDIPYTRWKEQYDDFLRFNIIKSGAMTQKNLEQVPTSNLYFGNLPVGNKYPLFGICRNNVSESVANSSDFILHKKYICASLQYHEGRNFYATRHNETTG
jgi:hypothetical protein